MTYSRIFALCLLTAAASAATAQSLDNEITVGHEVVPEEQAATRMQILPTVTLPQISLGRLPMAGGFASAPLTPFINRLNPANYLTSSTPYPWRGYASAGYGPLYNLGVSAGYRVIDKKGFSLDGYMQFDGMSYKSHFPDYEDFYADKVGLHRNSALIGLRTAWTPTKGNGTLTASGYYQYSGYNFPVLDLATSKVDEHDIDANLAKMKVGWDARAGRVDYHVGAEYNMIAFARDEANNGVELNAGMLWHRGPKSAWGFDLTSSFIHSTIIGDKGFTSLEPYYAFQSKRFSAKIGLTIGIPYGDNISTDLYRWANSCIVTPRLEFKWLPIDYLTVWGKYVGKMDDNARWKLYNEQPYLLTDFDASHTSRLYQGDAGIVIGPWRGASIGVFAGYAKGVGWYMPSIFVTGEMSGRTVDGWHGGVTLSYDYDRCLTLNASAEIATEPHSDYSRGYALWRDYAGFNLNASATVRPIEPLEITVGYQLRTHRSKPLPEGQDLNLRNISNLKLGVCYNVNSQWSAFIRGENLLNRHWYLGPSVPCQGIMGMIGAAYKF